jgi:hypothetical protein
VAWERNSAAQSWGCEDIVGQQSAATLEVALPLSGGFVADRQEDEKIISCQVESLLSLPEKRCRRYTTILVGCADGAGKLALRSSGEAAQRARHFCDGYSSVPEHGKVDEIFTRIKRIE